MLLYKHGTFDIDVLTIEFTNNLTYLLLLNTKLMCDRHSLVECTVDRDCPTFGSNQQHGVHCDKMLNNT